jgi:SAM-dependent methyltransferase
MKLRRLQRTWDRLAERDPFWAVLTDPNKKGGGWNQEEFFRTGLAEVDHLMPYLDSLGLPRSRQRALDFGCGVGRVTQALGNRFQEVCGVDVSPVMIRLAREYNRHGGRCSFVLNEEPRLGAFPDSSFDFIYSSITLQHMEPRFAKAYLLEFLRVLAPGGLLLFSLPCEPRLHNSRRLSRAWFRLYRFLYYRVLARLLHAGEPVVEMYGIPRDEVVRLLESHAGRVVDAQPVDSQDRDWISFRYAVTRDA